MTQHYSVIGISSDSGDVNSLMAVSRDEGIRVEGVEMTRKITILRDIKALFRLYRIFKQEKPFIVHTHTPKAGTLGMVAAKLAGVPNRLHTIAGLPLVEQRGPKRRLLNLVERITYSAATRIYPNSYGLVDIILKNRFTNKTKLKVIGNGSSNGINTQYFSPNLFGSEKVVALKKELEIVTTDFTFVFIGRLVKDKGINELIQSFVKLAEEMDYVKLLLVGSYESELDPLLPDTVKTIETHDRILGVGWQADVRLYLLVSDTLVFPSYREGFPNVVMQAGSMELPGIVTNINGCNEIITEGQNGFIIPPKQVDALYTAMKKVALMQKEEIISMGKKARKLVISKYEQRFVWEELLKEYKKLENH